MTSKYGQQQVRLQQKAQCFQQPAAKPGLMFMHGLETRLQQKAQYVQQQTTSYQLKIVVWSAACCKKTIMHVPANQAATETTVCCSSKQACKQKLQRGQQPAANQF